MKVKLHNLYDIPYGLAYRVPSETDVPGAGKYWSSVWLSRSGICVCVQEVVGLNPGVSKVITALTQIKYLLNHLSMGPGHWKTGDNQDKRRLELASFLVP